MHLFSQPAEENWAFGLYTIRHTFLCPSTVLLFVAHSCSPLPSKLPDLGKICVNLKNLVEILIKSN